jgi:hypothetical protein
VGQTEYGQSEGQFTLSSAATFKCSLQLLSADVFIKHPSTGRADIWTSPPPDSIANAVTHMHSEPVRDIKNLINGNSTSKTDLVLEAVSLLFRNLV